jgi:hypothetical protein
VRVGVRVSDRDALSRVLDRLPPGWTPARSLVVERLYSLVVGGAGSERGPRRLNVLYGDLLKLARTANFEQVLDALESDLQLFVAEMSRRRVFVHAGVVSLGGRAVLIPGRSFSGKTTLVRELVLAGATYYSDEYAVLDSRGRVHPFARPLGIRANGSQAQTRCLVEEFGGKRGSRPLPVGLVIVANYRPQGRWRPRKLTEGEGALALLANAVCARERPQAALATLRRVVANAPVFKSTRGEAGAAVEWVLNTLNGQSTRGRGNGVRQSQQ